MFAVAIVSLAIAWVAVACAALVGLRLRSDIRDAVWQLKVIERRERQQIDHLTRITQHLGLDPEEDAP